MASTLELEKYTSHAIIFNITTQLSAALFFRTAAGRWHKEFSSGFLGFLGWAVPAPEREPLRGCQIGCQGLSWRCHLSGRCAEVINGPVRQRWAARAGLCCTGRAQVPQNGRVQREVWVAAQPNSGSQVFSPCQGLLCVLVKSVVIK